MTIIAHNNSFDYHDDGSRGDQESNMKRSNALLLLLFFVSAVVFAQAGISHLPETYRTPLSDMVHEGHKDWRAIPEDKNPWREGEEDLLIKPRIKVQLFPQYTPDSSGNPVSRSLLQNEDEIERPASNIFKYTW
jgi:hypothetical protein